MSDEIRNLALQLRAWSEPIASGYEVPAAARTLHAAADALEAMAGEVDKWKQRYFTASAQAIREAEKAEAAESERDRLAGEVQTLKASLNEWVRENAPGGWIDTFRNQARERDRLKAALGAIAVKAGTSECGGNYVAAVSLIGDLEQMADAALRAAAGSALEAKP